MLVVDGNSTNRAIVQSYLEAGTCGRCCGDGGGGMASVRDAAATAQPYDLVLLDMHAAGRGSSAFGRRLGDESDLVGPRVLLMRALETQLPEDETHFATLLGRSPSRFVSLSSGPPS